MTGTVYKDGSLQSNTTYYYQIKATAAGGESAKSSEVSATTGSTPLDAPTLTASARDAQVGLAWNTVAGADYYDLYRLPNADGSGLYLRVQGGASSAYTDKSVTDGTTYTYWIAAGSSIGQGTPSAQVTATPVAQPTIIGAPVSANEVDLSWSASAGATDYHIDRSAVSNLGQWTFVADVTATSYADTGLTSGTDYYYRVEAYNPTGNSGPSNVVLAETFPDAPSGLTAAPGNAKVSLSWTAPSGDVGSYSVYRSLTPGGEAAYAAGLTGTTYKDTGVTNGTLYYYQVTAINQGGESVKTGEVSATPLPPGPTVAAAASASPNPATGTTTALSVLGASSSGVSNLTYIWSCASPAAVTFSANGTNAAKNTTATFTQAGSYVFTVTITDAYGSTAASSVTVTVVQTVLRLSISPRHPTVAAGSTIQLSALVYDQFGTVMPGTTVSWFIGLGRGTVDSTGLFTAPSSADFDEVQATSGEAISNDPVTVIPPAPSAPTGLTAAPGDASMSLTWTAPPGTVNSYNLYRATTIGGEGATPIQTGLTVTSCSDTGLTNGTTYYYEVSAVNSTGEGPKSNEASARPPYGPPTVATAAYASANPVTGLGILLRVLGASAGGLANLTCTWSSTGPTAVTFSPNGTSAAARTWATFTQAGTYVFTVTITDLYGGSVTSSVTVPVTQTATSVAVSPNPASLNTGAAQAFSAVVSDQFGNVMNGAAISWSETDAAKGEANSIDPASGIFSAGWVPGTATVEASSGSVSGTSSVTVTAPANGPYVVTGASATPSPVTGTTTLLTVLGSDALGGDSALTYTWALTGTPPSPVDYSDNGTNTAKNTTVTFGQAGTYVFGVTITDGMGLSATSSVTVVVDQTATCISVLPFYVGLAGGATQQFTASEIDQFGNAMTMQPASFTWSVALGTGAIDQTGAFIAPNTDEVVLIQASDGSLEGFGEVIVGTGGTVFAIAPPAAPTGLSATAGNKQITLTWSDSDTSITGYNVYRSYSSGGEGPTPVGSVAGGGGTGVTFTDGGLTNHQVYCYTVTAVNAGGESGFSNEASATPLNPPPVITVPPAVSPTIVTGTTAVLSVTGTDDLPGTTYTWVPTGVIPAPVTFSANGTTDSSTTTVTFTAAGTYTFTAVVTDADGATVTSTVTVTVAQTLTAVSVPSNPPPLSGNGQYFIQLDAADQFGNPMSAAGGTWSVPDGDGSVTGFSTPPGALFQAPAVTAPTTIPVTVTDGTLTKTISITVQPDLTGGHWGTANDPTPYQPVVSYSGTVSVDDPSNPGPASYTEDFLGGSYGGKGAAGQSASAALSGCGVAFQYTWVPDAPGGTPPSVAYLSVSANADANGLFSASGNSPGSADAADGLGDTVSTSTSTNGGTAAQSAGSSGTHVFQVDSHTGTASFAVPSLSASASGDVSAEVDAGASASVVDAPSVSITGPSLYSGAILPVEDVSVTVHASGTFGAVPVTYLQSLTLTVQGGGGGAMTPDVNDDAVFDLGTLTAGTYTLTATAVYDTDGLSVSVSSPPLTFYVATFSVKTQSWSPNPAAVTQVVTGQAQAKFDPSAVAGSPYFVLYTWTTAGVWYSPDGTPGTFEPCGGNYAVGWQQGQATTQFTAQFFDAGQYLLEVQCVANVYSVYNGSLIASYTSTGYVGGDASDIDTGGGNAPHAQRARALRPNAAPGGGAGITIVPATVTFSPDSLIKLGLGSPKDYFKIITATVAPANQASNVTFGASNGEVSVGSSADPATGVVTLVVTAVSATPGLPNNPSGTPDCNVTATDFYTEPVATVPVLVLKPSTFVETPTDTDATAQNLYFVFGVQPPDDWNVLPSSKAGDVVFATHAASNIDITIYDQFGNALDSMYDGYHVVHETQSGASTTNDAPIKFPDGQFSNGTIKDEVSETPGFEDNATDPDLSKAEQGWNGFSDFFDAQVGSGNWDNAFAIKIGSQVQVINQIISIYGFSLTGSWQRTLTFTQTNVNKKHNPHGIVMHIQEEYIPPPTH